jgi:CRP-like cAMP-binding protein
MILPEELEAANALRNLSQGHRNQIATLLRLRECPEGTVLFHEGEESPFIYFVLAGEAHLEIEEPHGETVEVYTAGPGDMLGWSPVLGGRAMTATARTATRCRLAILGADQVQALCKRDPGFAAAFLREVGLILSDRLRHTRVGLAVARYYVRRSAYALAHEGSD